MSMYIKNANKHFVVVCDNIHCGIPCTCSRLHTKYVHVHVIHVHVAIDLGNALTCTCAFIYTIMYMYSISIESGIILLSTITYMYSTHVL